MAISTPQADDGQTAWAVWKEGERAVVRVSDGTGFAVRADFLPTLWQMAGRPSLSSLAEPLSGGMEAVDLSHAAPDPDVSDVKFDLRQGEFAADARDWPDIARIAASAVGIGLAVHLGIAVADRAALGRIAERDSAAIEARLASRLPGATLAMGLPALVDRLAPAPEMSPGSDFLPLLGQSAAALLGDAPELDVQRLSWDADSGDLVIDITTASLEDLQRIERRLSDAGLSVASGTATAADGAARADIRIGGPR